MKDLEEQSGETSEDLSNESKNNNDHFNNFDISKILSAKGDGLKMSQVEDYV